MVAAGQASARSRPERSGQAQRSYNQPFCRAIRIASMPFCPPTLLMALDR
jgi:hypothetical protein